MAMMLRNAHLVDPTAGIDDIADVLIRDGVIVEVGKDLPAPPKGFSIDLSGMFLVPGMVDVHVHFRDPGLEHKETIETGMRAAAKGGFTGVVPMANTKPVIDDADGVRLISQKAAYKPGRTKVYLLGACTKGLCGDEVADLDAMAQAGSIAFSDDGRGVQSDDVMAAAMKQAAKLGMPVMSHCQFEDISAGGVMNEGAVASRLGLAGWPARAEEAMIARELKFAQETGCHIHIQHVTTAGGAELIRQAKAQGIPCSAEVAPHHLFLTEEDIEIAAVKDRPNFKMNPPLRTKEDVEALIAALIDGTIDMVATDHAPHAAEEKGRGFEKAPFGITGLETALGLLLTHLVLPGKMSWQRFVDVTAIAPRELLGIEQVSLAEGSVADLTVIDPNDQWTVCSEDFESKSKNSPFIGHELTGRATYVFTEGYATLESGKVTF